MAKKEKTVITGKLIEIKGPLARHKIVKKVVNAFIKTEYRKKGKGVVFRYPVENLPDGQVLYIVRPGYKKNFDFKVEVPEEIGLGKKKQTEIALDLRKKNIRNPRKFKKLWQAIAEIYHCKENDVDAILKKYRGLKSPFKSGGKPEPLLKVIKWLFIMEDIVYWDNEGRSFLFNFLNYVVKETDEDRCAKVFEKANSRYGITPDQLKSFMKKCGIEWVTCEG
ncbi:hypothetical protein ES703_33832 [subsurface metagenome]